MKYHILKHLHTINKHRFHVFINCCRCGIPFRGLVHDLSKYSPTEFFISAKNYSGIRSPIANERKEEFGYSSAFIHHTRKNKHHYEYWVDVTTGDIFWFRCHTNMLWNAVVTWYRLLWFTTERISKEICRYLSFWR